MVPRLLHPDSSPETMDLFNQLPIAADRVEDLHQSDNGHLAIVILGDKRFVGYISKKIFCSTVISAKNFL